MKLQVAACAFYLLLTATSHSRGGETYKITSSDGKTSYEVHFGGGFKGHWLTAFDPDSKQFVYISIKYNDPESKPVGTIWNHKTGETISLYKFPRCSQPLPAIESIKDITFFPLTNSKDFKVQLKGVID